MFWYSARLVRRCRRQRGNAVSPIIPNLAGTCRFWILFSHGRVLNKLSVALCTWNRNASKQWFLFLFQVAKICPLPAAWTGTVLIVVMRRRRRDPHPGNRRNCVWFAGTGRLDITTMPLHVRAAKVPLVFLTNNRNSVFFQYFYYLQIYAELNN